MRRGGGGRAVSKRRVWLLSPLVGGAASAPVLCSPGCCGHVLRASARLCEVWGIACVKVRRPQSQRSSCCLVLTVPQLQLVLRIACTDRSQPIAPRRWAGARSSEASSCRSTARLVRARRPDRPQPRRNSLTFEWAWYRWSVLFDSRIPARTAHDPVISIASRAPSAHV